MSNRNDHLLITDIQQAAKRITEYCEGVDFDGFMMTNIVKDAVIRNFEVIGVAAKNISLKTKSLHPEIEWKLLTNSRNRLIQHILELIMKWFGISFNMNCRHFYPN